MRLRSLTLALTLTLTLTGVGRDGAFAQGRTGAETEEEQTFLAAETAFQANKDDDAARLYEKVIALNPTRAEAYLKRSVIHYKRGEYSASVKLLRRAQQAIPGDAGIKAQLGLSLYRSGAKEMGVEMMEEVVNQQPQAFQVQLQLGEHFLKAGNGEKASQAFANYFKFRPEEIAARDVQYRPLAGNAYLYAGRYTDAQREFELTLKSRPDDFLARIGLATVYTATGECSRAITMYERMIAEAPRQPSIWFNLGSCYLIVNRRADAEKTGDAYTKARPKERKGWMLLGDARFQNRAYPEALAAYQEAAKLEPDNTTVQARLAKIHIAQKSYPAATTILETARKARPDDVSVLTQLAEVYSITRKNDREVLVEIAEKLARASDADALTAAGTALFVAGEDAQAERAFESAIKADTRAYRPKAGLQMTLNRAGGKAVDKGDLAGAEAMLVRAQALDIESVQTNRNLGLVLLLEKKYVEAEKALGLALRRVSRDLVVNRLLGRVYLGMDRRQDALRSYQAAEQVALRARGPVLAQIYAEMGPLYLDLGKADQGVSVLDVAVREAGSSPVLKAAQRNLAVAYYRRGLERLKDAKQSDGALEDFQRAVALPKSALQGKEPTAIDCALAIAALKAGKVVVSQEAFTRAGKEGGCQFAPPYDKVGVEFFSAYAQYRESQAGNPLRREATIKQLGKLLPRATGSLTDLIKNVMRASYELQGYEWYARNDVKRAGLSLRNAQKLPSKGEQRSLDHNLAVIELSQGRTGLAEKVFEQLAQRPPEALLNLGIVRDRQGDSRKALELYRKASERGVRAPKLKEWIDVKERILNSGGSQADRSPAAGIGSIAAAGSRAGVP